MTMNTLLRWLPQFPAYATPLDKAGWWLLRIVCVGVLVFLLLPILVIMPLSFSDSSFLVYPIPGWSLKWYENLFTSAEWSRAAKNSFIVAPSATVIATVLGTLSSTAILGGQLCGTDASARRTREHDTSRKGCTVQVLNQFSRPLSGGGLLYRRGTVAGDKMLR